MRIKYTKELLEPIVASSCTMAEVLRKLDLNHQAGGNYRLVSSKIRAFGLSTDHFSGQAWSRGVTRSFMPRQPDHEVFIENCPRCPNGPRLIKRLLLLGWSYQCHRCETTEWLGEPLTLHLDHINGINNDNRLENLRLLCPNCHKQTETWGNRLRPSRTQEQARVK